MVKTDDNHDIPCL